MYYKSLFGKIEFFLSITLRYLQKSYLEIPITAQAHVRKYTDPTYYESFVDIE